ncbi:MAG: hypothetical protein KDI50_03245 [Candidatus Competibacteraceae bacterium]|nr:hypothetical protein [Candidatus Competibacteraceae bacterium]
MSTTRLQAVHLSVAIITTVIGTTLIVYEFVEKRISNKYDTTINETALTIESAINSLPEGKKRQIVKESIEPIKDLIDEIPNTAKYGKDVDRSKENLIKIKKGLLNISLAAYLQDKSPFLPEEKRVYYLCGEDFSLTYNGTYRISRYPHPIHPHLRVNGADFFPIVVGDEKYFQSENKEKKLKITYLKYIDEKIDKKELKGPHLRYECRENTDST